MAIAHITRAKRLNYMLWASTPLNPIKTYSPGLLVAELLGDHLPQLQPESISHFLWQVVMRAPAEQHDVRHLWRRGGEEPVEACWRQLGKIWGRVSPLEGVEDGGNEPTVAAVAWRLSSAAQWRGEQRAVPAADWTLSCTLFTNNHRVLWGENRLIKIEFCLPAN